MGKITHQSYADVCLQLVCGRKQAIFLFMQLLSGLNQNIMKKMCIACRSCSSWKPGFKSMDKMIQEADITPVSLKKLGEGFQKLGTTVNGISDVSDVVKSTSDFSAKTKEATTAIGSMATAFTAALLQWLLSTMLLKVQKVSTNKYRY
jgi:hypothetical protein